MRDAEDLEEFEGYRLEDEPVQRCPECGDDDRHERDCSRNYLNVIELRERARLASERVVRESNYWLGYRHGRRIAAYEPDAEDTLREELKYAVGTDKQKTDRARAFALGELRGYRSVRP